MNMALLPGMSGPWEVLLVLAVVLLLFGSRKLPELARSLGKSLGEFKKGKAEGQQPDALDAPRREDLPESEEKTKDP